MVIFHSYVNLPEGILGISSQLTHIFQGQVYHQPVVQLFNGQLEGTCGNDDGGGQGLRRNCFEDWILQLHV